MEHEIEKDSRGRRIWGNIWMTKHKNACSLTLFFFLLRGVLRLYLTRDMHSLRHFTSLAVINCSSIFFCRRHCYWIGSVNQESLRVIFSLLAWFSRLLVGLLISRWCHTGWSVRVSRFFYSLLRGAHCWLYGLDVCYDVEKENWWVCQNVVDDAGDCVEEWTEQEELWRLKWIKLLTAKFFPQQ